MVLNGIKIYDVNIVLMPYILEVHKFHYGWNNDFLEIPPKEEMIGYMNKVFKTRETALEYYKKFNPHMRSLNKYDKKTRLMYIIKEHTNEKLTLPPF
jgi:hypothetical protein